MFAGSLEQAFDPYALLGVNEGIGPNSPELRDAWKLAVRKYHPDRQGGTTVAMQNALLAKQILSDPKKKKIFDQFGLKAVQGLKCLRSQQPEPNPSLVQETPTKPKTEIHTILKVHLSDLYCGSTRTVRVKYLVDCDLCCAGKSDACPFCGGKGGDMHVCQNTRSVDQNWKSCAHCDGGVPKAACFMCGGTKQIKIKTKLSVDVEPGMRDKQTILVETPFLRAAVTLKLRKHKVFRVSGNDLCFSKKITLKDCMQGSTFTVHTLDGRNLQINTPPNMVLNSGRPFKLPDEGLPIYKQHGKRGALYIRFDVVLPQQCLGPTDVKIFEHLTSSTSPTAEKEIEDEQNEEFSTLMRLKRGGDSLPHPVKRHLISVSKVAPVPSEDSVASRGTGFSMRSEGKNHSNRIFGGSL